MKELLQQYRALMLVLFMMLWPVYTYVASNGDRGQLGPLDRFSTESFALLQSHTDGALGSLSDLWEDYIDLVDVKTENERLRIEIARLRVENTNLRGISQENARLSKLADFRKQQPALELVAARVIAADVSPYFRVLRIRLDAGAKKVSAGMPVVSHNGVVGQVEAVHGDFCDVMLAIDQRSSIDILTQTKRTRGLLRGLGHERDYYAEIAHLLSSDEIQSEDPVVTSGRGQRFPKELPVGIVRSVDKKELGLYQTAIIEPAVDFSRLEEVYVITNAQQQGEEPPLDESEFLP